MKKITVLLFSLFLFLPLALAETQLLDQVVAVVNDEAVTQSELDSLMRPLYESFKNDYRGRELMNKLGEARRKLLNQLIEDRLVFQEAKKRSLQVDEAEIDRQITKFKTRFKTQEELEDTLHKEGISLTMIQDRFRRQAMVRELQDQEIRAKVVISPMEIERFYQEHSGEFSQQESLKIRSLTLKKNDETREKGLKDEEAWKQIQEIHGKIKAGANFSDMAKKFSQDSYAANGGLEGWIEHGQMISEIDEVIFKLKAGEVSDVVETSMGYHLFFVEEKKQERKRSFEEARDDIHSLLYRQKTEERFKEWMEELKRSAYISVR